MWLVFFFYIIYVATAGEKGWQLATFGCGIVSIFSYLIFWSQNKKLQITDGTFSLTNTSTHEGFMGLLGLFTFVLAIINWFVNNDKINNMKQDLPSRYWKAEVFFSLLLLMQAAATGYYFFVRKISTPKEKSTSPILWSGIVFVFALFANAATGEIWNITSNFITAG